MNGREEYFLRQGDKRRIQKQLYNFSEDIIPGAINIRFTDGSLFIKSDKVLSQMVMATQQRDTLLPGEEFYPLRLRSLYSDGQSNFVFGDFSESAILSIESEDRKVKGESIIALQVEATVNGEKESTYLYGRKGIPGRAAKFKLGGLNLELSYGSKIYNLPFSIKLHDFIMERYPGTNSAASYASEVQLIDASNNYKQDFRIFMNNILDYGGFRFFQSSFDQDEQGTYLSVNHDFWGTWISYIGYILLTLGLIFSLFSKKSRFYQLSQKIKKLKSTASAPILILFFSSLAFSVSSQKVIETLPPNIVDVQHAEQFSQLIVQDHNGRMKPVHTLTREVMRKIVRKESLLGLTADQIILGMFVNSRDWDHVPMIKLGKHEAIHKKLGVAGERAAYNDFFSLEGEYLLREEVRRAYELQPIDRGVLEKELMKLDERVNIASMIYSGRLFRLFPVPKDPNNTWVSNFALEQAEEKKLDPVAERFFATYPRAVQEANTSRDYSFVNQVLEELGNYQRTIGEAVAPGPVQVKAEIFLNELNVFNRLALVYLLLGLAFLVLLFTSVIKPTAKLQTAFKIFFVLVALGFFFHTLGLGLRWYVSGRAPWSNGYESMIYIAWTTTLAGLLFTRKSLGGLAATMVLAATVLLVASLSYLDPEITPLVPVLKSYWLTIHVSLEAGSYGFLMLGAIIGLINLILMIFLTAENKQRIYRIVKEMSYISEMTLIGGLIMVSVGTYLGGVWANESWGRYWGWDAKETWALVTILIYAFILHLRLMPKMTGLYTYNLATLFGWASVIMTYYGVNYYLSGLHSYAAGDPVPVPQWIYIVVAGVVVISALAYWKKRKFGIKN